MTAKSESESESTFLFADLAGFSALTEAHGDREAADVAADFFDGVRSLLPEFAAEEVKTIGDAVMLRCVESAAAVQLGLRTVNEVGARPGFPILRIGMHTGPAIERGGDWFGQAVNLAARVSATAAGNEVLLTEATREASGDIAGVDFQRRGIERFKNMGPEVTLFRALREGERSEGLSIDPVCRMAVNPGWAQGSLIYEGSSYVFCSLGCAESFAADPERYARRA